MGRIIIGVTLLFLYSLPEFIYACDVLGTLKTKTITESAPQINLKSEFDNLPLVYTQQTTAIEGVMIDPKVNDDQFLIVKQSLAEKEISLEEGIKKVLTEARKDPWFDNIDVSELKPEIELFLKSKFDGTAGGAFLLRFKYRKILEQNGIHPDDKPNSFSDLAKKYGYQAMQNTTDKDTAFDILKDGMFNTSAKVPRDGVEYNVDAVYMHLTQPVDNDAGRISEIFDNITQGKPSKSSGSQDEYYYKENSVVFFFPIERLDSDPWFRATPHWTYGKPTALSSKNTNMFGLVLQTGYSLSEVLFSNSFVLNSGPFFIATDTKTKAELLQKLKDQNVSPPNNSKWDDIILDFLPTRQYEDIRANADHPLYEPYHGRYGPTSMP